MAKLHVMGSGDAFGTGGRYQTCFWLEIGEKNVLVDCGANSPLAIKRSGKSIEDIDAIFITHFHGDHFGGLPFILTELAFNVQSKEHTIEIIGPEKVKERVVELQEAMYSNSTRYILPITNFREYSELDRIWNINVNAYPVTHSENSNPYGIRLEYEGHSFAYSGDGEWSESIISLADNSNLMIVECYDFDEQTPGHLNYKTIKEKSAYLNCDELYLTHLGEKMLLHVDELDIPALTDGMIMEF